MTAPKAAPPVVFTWPGALRGARKSLPVMAGVVPFAVVCGVSSQGAGLSLQEATLMSAFVYAGASQLVSLGLWGHPPPLLSVTLAAFVVNLRLALMGPVLAPWLDRLRGWRVWLSLFVMTDQSWAMSVAEMNTGGRDAGFLFGSGFSVWIVWVIATAAGFVLGVQMRPAQGHPLFFAALAVFVAILAGMWRGRQDLLPWVVAAAVASGTAQMLPGTFWYIVVGAVAGSVTGALRDERRR